MKIGLIALLCAVLTVNAFANKDKDKKEVPTLSDAQKIQLLIAERDLMAAQQQAAPYQFAVQQASVALQQKQKEIEKELAIESAKWQLNLRTLEFVEPSPQDSPHSGLRMDQPAAPPATPKK